MPSREGCRVFLGNLPHSVRDRDIERFFEKFGRVYNIFIKSGKYGFCEFDDYRDAEDAVYKLNGRELCGERITVEHARGPRRGGGGGRGGGDRYRGRETRRSKYGPPTRTHHRVIVENLSTRVSWQDLKDVMRRAGEVSYADAHTDRRNEGVVEFFSRRDMDKAIEKFDNYDLHGRRIRLVRDRSRSYSRSRSRSRSCSRSRSRSRSASRSRSRSSRSRSRGRKSRSRSRYRSRSRSRSVSRSRSRSSRSRSRPQSANSRSRSRSKSNERERGSPVKRKDGSASPNEANGTKQKSDINEEHMDEPQSETQNGDVSMQEEQEQKEEIVEEQKKEVKEQEESKENGVMATEKENEEKNRDDEIMTETTDQENVEG